jgi:hypothetical protein
MIRVDGRSIPERGEFVRSIFNQHELKSQIEGRSITLAAE